MSTEHNTILEKDSKTEEKSDKAKKFKVIMHNDDYTPFEFVQDVLAHLFNKSYEEARVIAGTIHTSNRAVVGAYPKNIAQTKADMAMKMAKENKYPLKLTVEE